MGCSGRFYFYAGKQELGSMVFSGTGPMAKNAAGEYIQGTRTNVYGYGQIGEPATFPGAHPKQKNVTRAAFPAELGTVRVKEWWPGRGLQGETGPHVEWYTLQNDT